MVLGVVLGDVLRRAPDELAQRPEIDRLARTKCAGERLAAFGGLQATGVQPCAPARSSGRGVRDDRPSLEDHPQEAIR